MLEFVLSFFGSSQSLENTEFLKKCAAYIYDRNDTCGFWYFNETGHHENIIPQTDITIEDVQVHIYMRIFGSVMLAAVGFFLIKHDKFKYHPYPLLGWTCLAEAANAFQFAGLAFKCYLKKNDPNRVTFVSGFPSLDS